MPPPHIRTCERSQKINVPIIHPAPAPPVDNFGRKHVVFDRIDISLNITRYRIWKEISAIVTGTEHQEGLMLYSIKVKSASIYSEADFHQTGIEETD